MKSGLAALVLLLAAARAAAFEPESKDALTEQCARNPGTTQQFCDCLAQSAVAELPVPTRHILWIEWAPPSVFKFNQAMTPYDLPDAYEKSWG
jgi:hypothetical protein